MQYIDDKAILGEALGDLVPAPQTEKGIALLTKWTKYEKTVHPDYPDQEIWPVNVGDDMSVVAVTRPREHGGGHALVVRQLVDQIDVIDKETGKQKHWQDGRPMVQNQYELIGMRPVTSARQALEILQLIRSAVEAVAARDVDGFGAPVDPGDEPDDDIAGFGEAEA